MMPQATALPASVVLPNNQEAEQIVICVFLNLRGRTLEIISRECDEEDRRGFDDALAVLRPEHFFGDVNARMWEGILALKAAGQSADPIALYAWAQANGRTCPGLTPDFLLRVAHQTPWTYNIAEYVKIVFDAWRLRRLIVACQKVAADAHGPTGEVGAFIDRAEAMLLASTHNEEARAEIPTMAEAIIRRVEDVVAGEGKPRNTLSTGLVDVDRLAGPMTPGQFIVIGAHSGVGKTSLGMQIALHVGSKCSVDGQYAGVYVVSQEMMEAELADRSLCAAAGIDTRKIAAGVLDDREKDAIVGIASRIETEGSALHTVFVDDRPSVSPSQLRRRARQVAAELKKRGAKLALIVIDYLQLCDGSEGTGRADRYEREVAYISKSMKELAKQLKCTVICIAQLNEDARREDRLPRGEDMAQCKAVRADADRILLIHNESAIARRGEERMDEEVDAELKPEVVQILVDKNRGGKEGLVHAVFQPSRSSFGDMDPEDRRKYVAARRASREAAKQSKRGNGKGPGTGARA